MRGPFQKCYREEIEGQCEKAARQLLFYTPYCAGASQWGVIVAPNQRFRARYLATNRFGMEKTMIYIVEDDENIRNLVQVALNGSGYETAAFETAEEALGAFKVKEPQLAIFDLMLPGMDGMEAIRRIRANDQWRKLPILVLTAKDKEYDKVAGLDGGADDYMTKPFSVLELLARVRSLLRRTEEEAKAPSRVLEFGPIYIDTAAREVRVSGRETVLTYKEYELLAYLVENRNRVVSRDELLDKLWDWRADVETRTLDIHIKTLRQKLGEEGGRYIKTVRSVGYRFTQPQE